MHTLSFSEARAQLAQTLRAVEADDEPVLISRRGRAAGVLMSCRQYQQLSGEPSSFAERVSRWRAAYLASAEALDEGDAFVGVRQRDTGRDFSW